MDTLSVVLEGPLLVLQFPGDKHSEAAKSIACAQISWKMSIPLEPHSKPFLGRDAALSLRSLSCIGLS